MTQKILSKISNYFRDSSLIVHSNLYTANLFLPQDERKLFNKSQILKNHTDLLDNSFSGKIYYPVFNYDFLKYGCVDLRSAASQVGPLGEYVRINNINMRTFDPVFSFSVRKHNNAQKTIKHKEENFFAFGKHTVFDSLYNCDGNILFYGAPFSSCTFLHYIEAMIPNGPVYRYEKIFSGTIIDLKGKKQKIEYHYHVRPLNKHMDYDFLRIEKLLIDHGIMNTEFIGNQNVCLYFKVRHFANFIKDKIMEDPLFLLDDKSKSWIYPLLDKIGRRFLIADFEKTLP